MKINDPFVEETRRIRMEHTKKFGSDLHRICQDLRKFEETMQDRVKIAKVPSIHHQSKVG